jgi:hypothetical protein
MKVSFRQSGGFAGLISIEEEGRPRRFAFSDRGVSLSTRPLLEFLRDRSAPLPP